jgi:hypothetical protein
MFILSQGYQGIVTSFMMESFYEPKIQSFNELFLSDYEIIVGGHFDCMMEDDEFYAEAKRAGRVVFTENTNFVLTINNAVGYAIILECENIELYGARLSDFKIFYVLEDVLFPSIKELDAGYINPYLEKFQYFMDLCFQAGLGHAWEVFEGITLQKEKFRNFNPADDSVAVLKFNDILVAFYVLPVGFCLAPLVFLCEIFFHDFSKNLPLEMYRKRYREWKEMRSSRKAKQIKKEKEKKVKKFKAKNVKVS